MCVSARPSPSPPPPPLLVFSAFRSIRELHVRERTGNSAKGIRIPIPSTIPAALPLAIIDTLSVILTSLGVIKLFGKTLDSQILLRGIEEDDLSRVDRAERRVH